MICEKCKNKLDTSMDKDLIEQIDVNMKRLLTLQEEAQKIEDRLDDFRKRLDERIKRNMEWISVTDELPELEDLVLVYDNDGDMFVAYLIEWKKESLWSIYCHCRPGSGPREVTHWMKLPPNPKDL